MSHKHAFEFLDRQLRDLCGVDSLFGGKVGSACILMQRILYVVNHNLDTQVIILAGDFRQVMPVVPKAPRAALIAASICGSHLWQRFRVMTLWRNMRVAAQEVQGHSAPDLQDFARWLLDVGEGRTGQYVDVPESMRAATHEPLDLVRTVFGDIANDPTTRSQQCLTTRAILTPLNDTVNKINEDVLNIFPGEKHTFLR
jgi:hypothetical protein